MYHDFHAPFVAWYPVKYHQQIKSILLPKLHNHPSGKRETGNALTTFNCSLDDNASIITKEIIEQFIWYPFDQMIKEKQFQPTITESYIKHLWWNQYSPGDYAIAHHHVNADFCGIYILDCSEDNTTVFHPHISNCQYPFDAGPYFTEHIQEGYTMIWPSYLMHSAIPAKKNRMIIAFNIQSNYTYFAEDHIPDDN